MNTLRNPDSHTSAEVPKWKKLLAYGAVAVGTLLVVDEIADRNINDKVPEAHEIQPGDEVTELSVRPGDVVSDFSAVIANDDEEVPIINSQITSDLKELQDSDSTLQIGTRIYYVTTRAEDGELESKYVGVAIGDNASFDLSDLDHEVN